MRRGAIITVIAPGDYGKPRPAVVIQADTLTEAGAGSIVLCLLSTHLVDAPAFRITVEPTATNGLEETSQIMVDKIVTVPRARLGRQIGQLDDETLLRLNRTLAFVIGLGQ
jgi:mRNA interferase MazF